MNTENKLTAVQELINWIEEHTQANKQTEPIWHKAKSLLEKEKQQIIDAFFCGWDEDLERSGEQYYNETFKNE